MMKITEKMNTTITEIEGTILKASINNQTTNATNILGVSEDLWYLIQSNMENWVYQVQRMLADELDKYKGWGNKYMNDNIWEIQDSHKEEEWRLESRKGEVEEEKVILIKPYKVSTSASIMTKLSFIQDEVENLIKYMKFICSPMQIRLFKLPLYYQSLQFRVL